MGRVNDLARLVAEPSHLACAVAWAAALLVAACLRLVSASWGFDA